MSDTTYNPNTHFVVAKKHRLRYAMGFVAFCVIMFVAFGGRIWPNKNDWGYVAPTIPLHLTSSAAAPHDDTAFATTPNGEPVEVQTKVVYPLRDAKALAQQALDEAAATKKSLDASLQSMKDQMAKGFDDVKQTLTAPPPAQQQAAAAAPASAPSVAPVSQQVAPDQQVQSQAAPAPQQTIVPTRTHVAASAGGANQDEMAAAAAAYKSLGPDLNGGHPLGHRIIKDKSEIGTGPVDACPPGQKRVITKSASYGGFLNIHTVCQ